MNVELMLLKPVKDLGLPGEIVKVRLGYARNYLLPRKLAAPASDDAMKQVDAQRKRMAAEAAKRLDAAKVAAESLANTSIHVEAKANEEGNLYGSVTQAIVSQAMVKEGFDVEPGAVQLAEPIKDLGIYGVDVKLHAEVSATVKLYVVQPPPPAE